MPPEYTELTSAVLVMPTNGNDDRFTVLVHGGAVLPGAQMPLGGVALAVLLTVAGGLAPTVAVTV